MSNLISENMLESFINQIQGCFPTYVAGVIADKHGLVLHSRSENPQLNEEILALSAVSDRKLMDLSDYQKVIRPLGMDAKLMVLLKKSGSNLHRFKQFNQVLKENPIE